MAMVLDAVSRWRKVEEATSSADSAPPVYLLDELASLAASSSEQAECVADHVNKRLQQQSPIVKWKALRLVRHLCNKGCTMFQRNMQRHASSIRELVHYQGEKDPFKGDSLNQRVRDAAKETMEVLYSSAPPPTSSSSMAPTGRIQGFGSTASGPPPASIDSYSSSYSARPQSGPSGRMVGFGSDGRTHTMQPNTPNNDLASTVTSAVSSLGNLIKSQLPTSNKEHTSALHGRSGSYGESSYVGFSSRDPPPLRSSGLSSNSTRSHPSVSVAAVMGSEEQLVNDICAPVGIRAAPDPEDLRKFVELASNMDGLRIGELLIQKMNSSSWQVVLRSLYALEMVLTRGSSQACGEVAVMFQSDPSPVTRAASSTQAAVKERAQRCLKLLLNDDAPVVQAPAAAMDSSVSHANAPPSAAAAPLMDFGFDDVHAQPAQATSVALQPAEPTPATPFDLLGGLDVSVPAVPTTAPAPAPAVAAAPQVAASHDPFGGLNLGGYAMPSAAPAALTQVQAVVPRVPLATSGVAQVAVGQPQGTPPPLDDFFASLSVSGGAPQQQQPAVQSFSSSAGFGVQPLGAFGVPNTSVGTIGLGGQQQLGLGASYYGGGNTAPAAPPGLIGIGMGTGAIGNGSGQSWSMAQPQVQATSATSWHSHGQQPATQQSMAAHATIKGHDAAFDFVKDILK